MTPPGNTRDTHVRCCCRADGKISRIYVVHVGGTADGAVSANASYLDLRTNQWLPAPSMNVKRDKPAAVFAGGQCACGDRSVMCLLALASLCRFSCDALILRIRPNSLTS
jgi:hypothetical protein